MKKLVIIAGLLGFLPQVSKTMDLTEDEQLALALKLSEASLKEEQQKILSPGIHVKSVEGLTVHQLAVQEEDRQSIENISCGQRNLLIAKAFNTLLTKKEAIIPESLHAQLKKMHYTTHISPKKCPKQLYAENFEAYMDKHKIELPSFFALGSQGNTVFPLAIKSAHHEYEGNIETTPDLSKQLQTIAGYLGTAGLSAIYFMCSDTQAQHWFLIVVVKTKTDSEPTLWYIDPKNIDISKYSYAHTFIHYIDENVIIPALLSSTQTQICTPKKHAVKK